MWLGRQLRFATNIPFNQTESARMMMPTFTVPRAVRNACLVCVPVLRNKSPAFTTIFLFIIDTGASASGTLRSALGLGPPLSNTASAPKVIGSSTIATLGALARGYVLRKSTLSASRLSWEFQRRQISIVSPILKSLQFRAHRPSERVRGRVVQPPKYIDFSTCIAKPYWQCYHQRFAHQSFLVCTWWRQ